MNSVTVALTTKFSPLFFIFQEHREILQWTNVLGGGLDRLQKVEQEYHCMTLPKMKMFT